MYYLSREKTVCHATWCHSEGFGQEAEQETEESLGESLYSLRKARQGRVNSVGVAGVNNPGGLWAIGVASSCLVPGPGMT